MSTQATSKISSNSIHQTHNPEVAGKCPEWGIESCPRYKFSKKGVFNAFFCSNFAELMRK
jgi:hypothetical protein